MKDDHMGNGQLKAAYNLQFTTQNQFIINYSLHQCTTDTTTFKEHYQQILNQYSQNPKHVVADAGYGSEENYTFLEENNLESYVKYNYFHREQRKGYINQYPFHYTNLYFDKLRNRYICPMGQTMSCIGTQSSKTKTGFETKQTLYQAQNCSGCSIRAICHKSKGNRIIAVNHNLNRLKENAKNLLTSPQGKAHRSQRPVDVEAAFGNLKQNKSFKRFMLRGLDKVSIETALLAIAINLKKAAKQGYSQYKAAKKQLYLLYQKISTLTYNFKIQSREYNLAIAV